MFSAQNTISFSAHRKFLCFQLRGDCHLCRHDHFVPCSQKTSCFSSSSYLYYGLIRFGLVWMVDRTGQPLNTGMNLMGLLASGQPVTALQASRRNLGGREQSFQTEPSQKKQTVHFWKYRPLQLSRDGARKHDLWLRRAPSCHSKVAPRIHGQEVELRSQRPTCRRDWSRGRELAMEIRL